MNLTPKLATCFVALSLAGCCIPSHPGTSIRLLKDIARPPAPQSPAEFTRRTIRYETHGHVCRADVYLPPHPRAGVLLVPGVAKAGKDDPRLVAFATALCRAKFAVFVPDLVDVRELKVGAQDIGEIADAFACLVSRPELAPQERAGIVAASYAAGPSMLAAMRPDIRDRVHFILSIGGYYNLPEVLTFATTGSFRMNHHWNHATPNPYGKWVFALSNADRLSNAEDRAAIRAIAQRKLVSPEAPVADLAKRLHASGRAIYEFLTNQDPARAPALIARLPAPILADIAALDLARHDLSSLHAHVILIHGRDDTMIPSVQSEELARALPPGRAHVCIIRALSHVDVHRIGLADALKLLCAIDRVDRVLGAAP